MSVKQNVARANAQVEKYGAKVPTVSVDVATGAAKKVGVATVTPAGIAYQALVPGTSVINLTKPNIPESGKALIEGVKATVKNIQAMDVLSTSADGVIVLSKRSTADDPYGFVSVATEGGNTRVSFVHYPVHFMDEKTLAGYLCEWTTGKFAAFEGMNVKNVKMQFEGLLVKVFADASGKLRFVTKKKAQLCKEHEVLLMDTMVQNCMELNPGVSQEDALAHVLATLATYTHNGLSLTFRLIHPSVTYVRGPLDLSKNTPKAVLVQYCDKQLDSQCEVVLKNAFMTAEDVIPLCELDDFGAVMVELENPVTGVTHYAKMVSWERHNNLRAVEGINGNFRAFAASVQDAEKVEKALDPYHIPAFKEAVKQMHQEVTAGREVVAKFLQSKQKTLKDDKSELVAALFKMDAKLAKNLIGAATMYNPKKGTALSFVDGMSRPMLDGHIKLLTKLPEKKLTAANPDVVKAAQLVKASISA